LPKSSCGNAAKDKLNVPHALLGKIKDADQKLLKEILGKDNVNVRIGL